eukprot:TRINITY_DN3268_c0_g1_i1.p1 TRINITY_DN3268_c0_g1~~TRINITY_DN3268_c0_g1_i1.p1  ORF type:complete len:313 (-),score=111.13 TRINITY_DN3268_c0_g1_i1:26-934(-)
MHEYLKKFTIKDLVGESREIVTVKTSDNIDHLLRTLSESHVSACPVVNKEGEVQGVVDMMDVVHYIAKVLPNEEELSADQLGSLEIAGRAIALELVEDIMNASGADPYIPVYLESTANEVVSFFAAGTQRCPVLDHEDKLVNIVAQSDVVKVLAKEGKGHIKLSGDKTIKELNLHKTSKLIHCHEGTTVMKAISRIDRKGVHGLAIIDQDKKLTGTFSSADLESILKDDLPNLTMGVVEFLEKYSPDSLNVSVLQEDSTLADALELFATSNVHRLWVLDEDYKPEGVVSMSDIMHMCNNADA